MRYLICVLLFATPVYAQSKLNSHSGSVLVGETKVSTWPLKTSFGLLQIPTEEVRGIEFGIHYDDGVKDAIVKAVKALSSPVYKERELAQKDLVRFGKYAVPFLSQKSDDMEVVGRMKLILDTIVLSNSAADKYKTYDVIRTSEGDHRGMILLDEVEISHPDYGSAKVKLSAMSSMLTNLTRLSSFEIKTSTEWKDSGIHYEWGNKLTIRAEGRVELWPQAPGQYVATSADGLVGTAGRGGNHFAGQLVVKIGEAGSPMSLHAFNTTPQQRAGTLMFLIIPNPWNTPSEGFYNVTVKGD